MTLRDVAAQSGVSITTVSRILNGSPSGVPIREATRERVLAVAAELGYKPNLLARGLRGSRMSLLGVIARDIGDPFHTQIIRGINDVARTRDYRMFLGHVDYRPDVALSYGSMFERSHADGVIVVGDIEGGDATVEILSRHHRHVLGVTDRTARREFPGVYGDSVTGTDLALVHLWDLGHRRIVCVSDDRTYDGRLRIDLYERFMRQRGRTDDIAVHITDQEPQPALEVGRTLFADWSETSPSAVYATSDTIAIGLMKAAFEAGIGVPAQLSIVGFDDIDFARFTLPPLTTVSQNGEEMGRIAAGLLLEMIEGNIDGSEVDDVVIQPILVIRDSTASIAVRATS